MFEIVDVLDGGSEDETWEHNTDAVRGLVLLDVFPNSQFAKLLPRAVTDVRIISFSGIFECDLNKTS